MVGTVVFAVLKRGTDNEAPPEAANEKGRPITEDLGVAMKDAGVGETKDVDEMVNAIGA